MLLVKTLPFAQCQLKTVGDSGRFEGYASVFNVRDTQGDIVLPGAFKATLAQHGLPKMFFNHKWDMPIGRYEDASEDQFGLYVKGELTPGHSLASDVTAAMRHETLDGLSVGGFVSKSDYSLKGEAREIKVWTRLAEISPCAFPANTDARITSVKSADAGELLEDIAELESIRELERFLRDAGGLSKGAATALVARAKALLGAEGEPGALEQEQAKQAQALQQLHQRIERLAGRIPA